MRLKPEDIKYRYCTLCLHNYAICPDCGANSCGASCQHEVDGKRVNSDEAPCGKSGFWEVIDEARNLGYIPEEIQPDDINRWIDRILNDLPNFTEDEKDMNATFGGLRLDEEMYWYIKRGSDSHGMTIPSFDELCERTNTIPDPERSCKTGRGFMEERPEIKILEYSQFGGQEGFENEKMPWIEYCNKRMWSECDCSESMDDFRRRLGFCLAGEAAPGLKVKPWHSIYAYKEAEVVDNSGDLTKLRLKDTGEEVSINKLNELEILDFKSDIDFDKALEDIVNGMDDKND